MATKATPSYPQAQNPLILRNHRLMEAFAKSDDERDFYLDRVEGFILYANLDKTEEELEGLAAEIENNPARYTMIPKLTFFETKKIMENFVHEKVYDIDAKEKLMDIIQTKEAREHFLEFIYDHHAELEKWQQFYQERSRIRIIEWLRAGHIHFVFEEDLDLPSSVVERLKENLFEKKVNKELEAARKVLTAKAKSYYSNEALNPRPKRGRPPKQIQKVEIEPQISTDIYTTVPPKVRPFLFTPEITSVMDVTFSSKFESGRELLAHSKQSMEQLNIEDNLENITHKLAALRQLSNKWVEKETVAAPASKKQAKKDIEDFEEDFFDEEDDEEPEEEEIPSKPVPVKKQTPPKKEVLKKSLPAKAKNSKNTLAKHSAKPPLKKPSVQKNKPEKFAGKKRIVPLKPKTPPKPPQKSNKAPAKSVKQPFFSKQKGKAAAAKKPAAKKSPPPKRLLRKTTPRR